MQNILEADRLATVASINVDNRGRRSIIRHGVVWGLGHMATLCVFADAVPSSLVLENSRVYRVRT